MQQLIPLVLMLVVGYLLLVRPQKQRVRQQRDMVASLSVGDDVVTVGGLLGHIIELDSETALVETTPGTRLRFRRSAVAGRIDSVQPDDESDPNS